MNLIIATKNKGKIREFKEIFQDTGIRVISLLEINPNLDVVEDLDTFEGNALKKARYISEFLTMPVIADDSGLSVDYLDGRPGVYSARYAGNHDDTANNIKLLEELNGVDFDNRSAQFITCIACVLPTGEEFTIRGTCEGNITESPRGENGFAYDELFQVKNTDLTLAEMDNLERQKYSHRKKAIANFMESDFYKENFEKVLSATV